MSSEETCVSTESMCKGGDKLLWVTVHLGSELDTRIMLAYGSRELGGM